MCLQVVAREELANGKASAPVSIKINVRDENDNPPILHPHPPITIQAGGNRRRIAVMNATDLDEDDSIRYRIIQVTGGNKRTFYVNPTSGDLEVLEFEIFLIGNSVLVFLTNFDNVTDFS